MRLVTFENPAFGPRVGALVDGDRSILDLASAAEARWGLSVVQFSSMQALIDAGPRAWDATREIIAAPAANALLDSGSVRLLAPIPLPLQMRDFMTFEEHANGGGKRVLPQVWFEQPLYYKCNRFSVQGTGADVVWPAYSNIIDYECELAVVIGKTGKNIRRDTAAEHIFGFTVFNDFSARDAQFREMAGYLGPAKGKDFDGASILGPCIVTADEIDPYDLEMIVRINGEERSRGHSGTMHHRFEDMIAHVSDGETLHAGEILCSGTVGKGSGDEQGRFLAKGDVVELEIPGIGVLRNRVV